ELEVDRGMADALSQSADSAPSGVIRWEVEEISKLSDQERLSQIIEVEGISWYLTACMERKEGVDNLGIYLNCSENQSISWSLIVPYTITLLNQAGKDDFVHEGSSLFNHKSSNWGWSGFIGWENVMNTDEGFIHDDKIIIEARFSLTAIKGIRRVPRIDFTDSADSRHDVTLIVEGKKLHVNRSYLALYSPYFNTMFFGDFVEKNKEEIEIKNVAYEEFAELLNVIYPSYKTIADDNVEFLLSLGDQYEIKLVTDKAESFLISSTKFSIPAKFKISDQYRLLKLQDHCLNTLKTVDDVRNLTDTDDYEELSDAAKVSLLERIRKLPK
ncbi:hypothetical protein PFISCL1PPCAC_21206, partial [Pristionchus fissidentatus]